MASLRRSPSSVTCAGREPKSPAGLWAEDKAVPLGGVVAVTLAESLITMHATVRSCTPQVIWSSPIRFPPAPKITFSPDAKGFPFSLSVSGGLF